MSPTKSEPVIQTNTVTPRILYVEDDKDDGKLLMESFAANASCTEIVWATDGQEAINFLDSAAKDALPALIILDLNLPKVDGRQTLSYIKSNPRLAQIPVVILSTSQSISDKEACASLGASSYLEKPFHLKGYTDIVNHCIPFIY